MNKYDSKKNLKIVLLNPPMTPEHQAGSLKGVANMIMPLGIGFIAAVLEENGFDVKIIDSVPLQIDFNVLKEMLKKERPDILGITSTILSVKNSIDAAKELREVLPETLFVIGGPHFTAVPLETMENSCFDVGIIGEGEYTMLELAEQMAKGNLDYSKIKGIVYRAGGKTIVNERRPYIENLDELPFPARHLYPPLKLYAPNPGGYKQLPFAHMTTSRGCPNKCIFCDRSMFGTRFRAASAKKVVDEIELLVNEYGVKEIKFYDDIFTEDNERVMGICDEIIRRGIKITWSCSTRVNRVNRELLKKMKKAGCWMIDYGIESGDQKILNTMKKGITLNQSRRAVKWTKELGMKVRAYILFGMPGETLETMRRTIDFAKELNVDAANFYALMLYPGNELYGILKKEGKVIHSDYSQYSSLIDVDRTRLHYIPDSMTEDEFKGMISRAYREFYLRPSYILSQMLSIRSFLDIKRYWLAFKTIVNM